MHTSSAFADGELRDLYYRCYDVARTVAATENGKCGYYSKPRASEFSECIANATAKSAAAFQQCMSVTSPGACAGKSARRCGSREVGGAPTQDSHGQVRP